MWQAFVDWVKSVTAYAVGLVSGYQLKRFVDQEKRAEGIKDGYEQLENARRLSPSKRADILRKLSSKR